MTIKQYREAVGTVIELFEHDDVMFATLEERYGEEQASAQEWYLRFGQANPE